MYTVWTPNGHVSGRVRWGLTLATVLSLVAVWACRPVSFPGPLDVLRAYPGLLDDGLLFQAWVSVSTNLEAIGLSCLIAIPLAYLTVVPAAEPFVRVVSKMRFLGFTGFVMLFTVIFGGGHALKLALLTFGMSVFLVTSLYDVVAEIPREEFDYARTLRMGPWRSVLEIVVLGRMDAVLGVVRQNAAMGLLMLAVVEGFVRFEGGLGAMMLAQDKHLRLESVFALQALVLAIGVAQDAAFVWLRRELCPFADITLERR